MQHDDSHAEPEPTQALQARVEYVALAGLPQALGVPDVLLTVHPRSGDLPVRHYLELPAARPGPGCDLVAVITLGTINSPDEAQILDARLDGHRMHVHATLRVFEGRLAANVQRLACVVVELGQPAPGHYDAEIRIDRAVFTEYGHPERAKAGSSSCRPAAFEVAGTGSTA